MPEAFTAAISELLALNRESRTSPAPVADVTALFEQFRRPLFRYLLFLGLNTHDAEEVIQEVFLALFQHLKNQKSRANLRGWIFRVAHNQAMRIRRSAPVLDENLVDQMDPEPNPEQLALTNQRQRRLSAVLHALPEQDRACLSLRAEGLRYREIAGILNISLGSVAQSLSRSISKLERAHDM
jgi:RNA polymerase sigma-70 factor (ECF subfamily)